jgi:GcrA cell cycle regulator
MSERIPGLGIIAFTDWTDEKILQLRELWGKASIRVIAEVIGCTANAVAGKAHRIGLPRLASPIRPRDPSAPPRSRGAPRNKPAIRTTLPLFDAVPPAFEPVAPRPPHLLRQCTYLYGDKPPYRRCSGEISTGQGDWCEDCRKIVFIKSPQQRAA